MLCIATPLNFILVELTDEKRRKKWILKYLAFKVHSDKNFQNSKAS